MIRKNDIIISVYKLLKRSDKPLTQKEIIKHLLNEGYKRTTIQTLFQPSILQPLPFNNKGEIEFSDIPLIIKKDTALNRPVFMIQKEWRKIPEHEICDNLIYVD